MKTMLVNYFNHEMHRTYLLDNLNIMLMLYFANWIIHKAGMKTRKLS